MRPSGRSRNNRADPSSPIARQIGRHSSVKKPNKYIASMERLTSNLKPALDKFDKDVSYILFRQAQKLGPKLRPFLLGLEWSCHGLLWFAGVIILAVYNQQSSLLAQLFIGLFMDVIYVGVIKALTRRRRPTYANQRDQYMVVAMDKHSFPSGHCTRAVYVACFINNHVLDPNQVPLLALLVNLWAFSVSASRVALGRHHLFDCFAGIMIGFIEYWLQFHTFLPINFIGFFLLRSLIGNRAFSDTNDMDDISYTP